MYATFAETTAPTLDDVLYVARNVIGMLRDTRSDARRLGQALDCVPTLADSVQEAASSLYAGRGQVYSTAHAVTLLGFARVERLVRRYMEAEMMRAAARAQSAERPSERSRPRYASLW